MKMSEPNVTNYEADEIVVDYLAAISEKNGLNGMQAPLGLVPKKPRFIYIPKNRKVLSKFHTLLKSIKKNCYHDVIYYMSELLYEEDVTSEEVVKVLCDYYKAPIMEDLMVRVYATLYDDAAFMARLKADPVLRALAYSDVTTLAEINKYIKSRLTAEELPYFIGDELEALPRRGLLPRWGLLPPHPRP